MEAGTDDLDIQSARLTVTQRQNSLADARETLSKYTISSPYSGVISGLSITKGESVSSGSPLATIITKDKIAELQLNEIDAAKVAIGQEAELTFDALDGVVVKGVVSGVDPAGTVSSGVVTYTITVSLIDAPIEVKESMSVSATIITAAKKDIVVVPTSAIKSDDEGTYIEYLSVQTPVVVGDVQMRDSETRQVTSTAPPKKTYVEVGITDDIITEIISGVVEGDSLITKTTTSTTAATTTPSLFSAMGVRTPSSGGSRGTGSAGQTQTGTRTGATNTQMPQR